MHYVKVWSHIHISLHLISDVICPPPPPPPTSITLVTGWAEIKTGSNSANLLHLEANSSFQFINLMKHIVIMR